eukprot:15450888-Alexandrium_andersonii.AAC.1
MRLGRSPLGLELGHRVRVGPAIAWLYNDWAHENYITGSSFLRDGAWVGGSPPGGSGRRRGAATLPRRARRQGNFKTSGPLGLVVPRARQLRNAHPDRPRASVRKVILRVRRS